MEHPFNQETYPVFCDYLMAVREQMVDSNVPEDEQETILEALCAQLEDKSSEQELTIEQQETIVSLLSPPESFRRDCSDHNKPTIKTVASTNEVSNTHESINMKSIYALIAGLLIIALVTVVISLQRGLMHKAAIAEAAQSQVENVLQRRYDLIPNLVATVKGNAKFEQETLTKITELRSQWMQSNNTGEKSAIHKELSPMLLHLTSRSQTLPTLQANQAFRDLMVAIEGSENRISIERRRYNVSLTSYNASLNKFPENLIARFSGLTRKEQYFSAQQEAHNAPKVEF